MSIQLKIKHIYGAGLVLTTCLFFKSTATAQPVPDETLPNNSEVNLEDNTYQINGGTVAGDNLLHSFEEFSIPTGTEASFNNDLAIQNIISRVTGGSISNIDGILSANGNANLFLINPNGIIFGSNSSLNIGGSFIATTADSLQFADGREFSASDPQSSLLTISTPVGLQFGDTVGSITNQSGELKSTSDNTISDNTIALVGGDINLQGASIESFLGNIELGSVASNSQVNLIPIDAGWTFDYDGVLDFGDIELTQAQNAIERESDLSTILSGADIQIQGKKVTITDGTQIISNNTLKVNASDILTISGSIPSLLFDGFFEVSSLSSLAFSDTDGGDIVVNANQLVIKKEGRISSEVGGIPDENRNIIPASGNGGDITINVTESIEVTDENSGIFSSTAGFGDAGNITINTKDLLVRNGAIISAESTGGIALEQPVATGLGGEIQINASESIRLNDGIISSSTSGEGDNAGSLSLEADRLSVLEGSQISVNASGSGLAGNLEIAANSIILDRSSLDAETRVGDEGNITLNDADTLLLRNNSRITTNAFESATGGDITLDSEGIALLDDSDITADAEGGQGGNIQITAQGILQEPDSEIRADSELGIDGTVTFNTPDVDPVSGIEELPNVPVDTEAILAQDFCKLENEQIASGSSFVITGRGGLIPTSKGSLDSRDRLVDWVSRDDIEVSQSGAVGIRQREDSAAYSYPKIQQSQGLLVAADGSTWLTANAPNTDFQNSKILHPDCNTSK